MKGPRRKLDETEGEVSLDELLAQAANDQVPPREPGLVYAPPPLRTAALLTKLKGAGYQKAVKIRVGPWMPLHRVLNYSPDPLLVLSGNVSAALLKSGLSETLSRQIQELYRFRDPIVRFDDNALASPLVFARGDIISEVFVPHILLTGTFLSNTPPETSLLRLPKSSEDVLSAARTTITERAWITSRLLIDFVHKGHGRINDIAASFFSGNLPVHRGFYIEDDRKTINAVPSQGASTTDLRYLTPTSKLIGVQVSTAYLSRYFGISKDAIGPYIEHDLSLYSEAVISKHKKLSKTELTNKFHNSAGLNAARQQWKALDLSGTAVLLFMNSLSSPSTFCREHRTAYDAGPSATKQVILPDSASIRELLQALKESN